MLPHFRYHWLALSDFEMFLWSWTIYYDTIYAVQDKDDDARAGIRSTAILFGRSLWAIMSSFAMLTILSLVVAGIMNKQGFAYFLFSCGGTATHFYLQLSAWDVNNREQAGVIFKVCRDCCVSTLSIFNNSTFRQMEKLGSLYSLEWFWTKY